MLPKDIKISLLQENTRYFNVAANLKEKTLDAFKIVSKSRNESNNSITENNKAHTEPINNLLLKIATTSKTLLNNSTPERNILNDNNDIKKEVGKWK